MLLVMQFLHLLEKTLPPWRINFLLVEFLDDFPSNVKDEATWQQISEVYPPHKRDWSDACKQHDSPYTCGLWSLFHIMTVGLVEFNDAVLDKNNIFGMQSPKSASLMLREYVHNFFPCEV